MYKVFSDLFAERVCGVLARFSWIAMDGGLFSRVLLSSVVHLLQLVMRWFQYSIADFEETLNPENGTFVVMERKEKEDTVCTVYRCWGAHDMSARPFKTHHHFPWSLSSATLRVAMHSHFWIVFYFFVWHL